MFFLMRAYQKCYIFLLKQLRYSYNVVRDEYPVTNTSSLDLLICTEVGIQGNQKSSTYEGCRG